MILLKFITSNDTKSQKIKEKVDEFQPSTNFNYKSLFSKILPNTVGWYISIPSNNRELKEAKNERDKSKYLNNVFLRPIFDSILNETQKKSFYLKGAIQISTNKGYNNSSFIVDDFITVKNNTKSSFEKEFFCETNYISINKENFDNYNSKDNIITTDFLQEIPLITSPKKINSFSEKWNNYLEFERNMFTRNMQAIQINEWDIISLVEVSKTLENEDLFKKDIIHSTEQYLYINSESSMLKGNNEIYYLMKISILKDDINLIEIRNFARANISIINYKGVEILNKLKQNKKTKENNKIKSINLGDLLYVKELNNSYTIVKYILEEGSTGKLKEKFEKFGKELYIADIASGDIALYKRGKEALENLEMGNFKNPVLASYILEPERYDNQNIKNSNIAFRLRHLNEKQKEAVIKCLENDTIFLIQGPPGTGKTQVITELVYQYIKRGERVLLSSQTHIAIDNVLERLPNEINILPIRLVNESRKARQDFLPDKLVDILYENIEKKYSSEINEFKNFSNKIVETENKFKEILALQKRIETKRLDIEKYENEREELIKNKFNDNDILYNIDIELKGVEKKLKLFEQFINSNFIVEKYYENLDYKPLYQKLLSFLVKKENLIKKIPITLNDLFYLINKISGQERVSILNKASLNNSSIPKELIEINSQIEEKDAAIKVMRKSNIPPKIIKIIIKEINELNKKKKEFDDKKGVKSSEKISEWYFTKNEADINRRIEQEIEAITDFNEELKKILQTIFTSKKRNELLEKKHRYLKEKDEILKKIKSIDVKINRIEKLKQKLEKPIEADNQKIEQYFNEFFTNKEKLDDNSIPETDKMKLDKIEIFINKEKQKLGKEKQKLNKVQGIYKSVLNHLGSKSEFIRNDRINFNKDLFINNANIFGITCTSSPYFSESKNSYLHELGLGDVSVKDKDFDVVIIDEVSKATPIEILIPILYGKKIIIVGDHRQLPPIFKYRESNFNSLEKQEKRNMLRGFSLDYYKKMVESSFFEEIFSKLKYNKTTLTQQYRFHEQIMECVNVFYNEQLEMGLANHQNNKKQHNLEISLNKDKNDIPIIIKSAHTYWFDSGKDIDNLPFFEKINEGETSLYNPLEAKLTVELIKKIDNAYGNLKKQTPEVYKRSIGDYNSDRPSLGIISMYGKHVGYIKKLLKKEHYSPKNILLHNSTIDDYQGKENDIIILNFVRNNTKKKAGEFIRKFNRINVAISRARNLLIIIGAKDFTNSLNVEVPDMHNNIDKIKAYQKIYERCDKKINNAASRFEIKIN